MSSWKSQNGSRTSSRNSQSNQLVHPMDRLVGLDPRTLCIDLSLALGRTRSVDMGLSLALKSDVAYISQVVDPRSYTDFREFRDDYFISSYLKKWPGLDLGIDRTAVALSAFNSAELACEQTNRRIKNDLPTSGSLVSCLTPLSLIHSAREKVSRILGDFSWDECSKYFSFGSGATASLKRKRGDAYYKFGEQTPTCTSLALPLAVAAIRMVPRWTEALTGSSDTSSNAISAIEKRIKVIDWNRVDFVPKNAKTDRTIAIEPTLNGYLQSGIGAVIRRRLRKVEVDLNDQHINQRAARWGAISGLLATVDLSAASDSVSMELVRELLPPDWYEAIYMTRSPYGKLPDGTFIKYQKVSSMGNGFTFELESLIFWALAKACVDLVDGRKRRVRVYGDDIIVPSKAVPTLRFILEYCGFSFNSEKSFWTGPFRESCGKHYFHGHDVTPLYYTESKSTVWSIIKAANHLRRWARLPGYGLDGRVEKIYKNLVSLLPEKYRQPLTPDGVGDYALFGDFDEVTPRFCMSLQCYVCKKFDIPMIRNDSGGSLALLPARLSLIGKSESLAESVDKLLSGLRQKWSPPYAISGSGYRHEEEIPRWRRPTQPLSVRSWPSYGPWY